MSSDRTVAAPSAAPAETAKEISRQGSASPSSNSVGDQTARLNRAAEPAPFAFLLSPWLWLVLALAFGALSFIVGRRLRSA